MRAVKVSILTYLTFLHVSRTRTSCGPGTLLQPGDAANDATCVCKDDSFIGDPYSSIGCTQAPTHSPTSFPTGSPTRAPTKSPTSSPTPSPTAFPTKSPSHSPTKQPTYECLEGFWDDDDDKTTACVAHSDCDAGFGVVQLGNEIQDTICAACEFKTMSAEASKEPCIPWATCALGQGVKTAGSTTSHPVCEDCTGNKFSDVDDSTSSCRLHRTCASGQGVIVFGNSSQDFECEVCPDGYFSSVNSREACRAHRTCSPGTYVDRPGTTTSNRRCSSCVSGKSFSAVENANACDGCKTSCPVGEGFVAACTLTTDTICNACSEGFYSDIPDLSPCQLHRTSCGPGTLQPGDAANDATCVCKDDSFIGDPYSSIDVRRPQLRRLQSRLHNIQRLRASKESMIMTVLL